MEQALGPEFVSAASGLVPVRTRDDLDWYVKEREMLTGKPGRIFVVEGKEAPTYVVQLDPAGYLISPVHLSAEPDLHAATIAPDIFERTLGSALLLGRLYTPALHSISRPAKTSMAGATSWALNR